MPETERLVLREPTPADLTAYRAVLDDVVVAAMGWSPAQMERMDRRLRARSREQGVTLICDRTDGSVLGVLSYHPSGGVLMLGVMLGPAGRGRGLAAEALAAHLDDLARLGTTLVGIETSAENRAMRAVAERCGFTEVDRYDHVLPDGTVVPAVRYLRNLRSG